MELRRLGLEIPDINLGVLAPHIILAVLFVLTLLFELFRPEKRRTPMAVWAPVGAVLGLLWVIFAPAHPEVTCHKMLLEDGLSRGGAAVVFLTLALTTTSLSRDIRASDHLGEYLALMLAAGLGMTLMMAANNTMMVFVGLELFSLALYLLCIFLPERRLCQESGLKYFILSSLASAVLLYGFALLYGATGTTWLDEMRAHLTPGPLIMLGAALTVVGLAFKISAVPFHVWTPDVYQGAPTPVTGFMSVATKSAALISAFRIFPLTLGTVTNPSLQIEWSVMFWTLAVITILMGNLMAIAQTDLKRMLAYSSIAHGGYLLTTIFVGTPEAEKALIFYLLAYSFMNVGAFTAIAVLEDEGMEVNTTTLKGLASRYPAVAAGLAYCLFGLTGLPITGGFLAKFQLLGMLLHEARPLAHYLAVTAIIGSFFGACYYLRVVALMYSAPKEEYQRPLGVSFLSGAFVLATCLAGVALTGIFAEPVLRWLDTFHTAL